MSNQKLESIEGEVKPAIQEYKESEPANQEEEKSSTPKVALQEDDPTIYVDEIKSPHLEPQEKGKQEVEESSERRKGDHQSQQKKKEPLKLKFKGIILHRVIGQVFRNHREPIIQAFSILKRNLYRKNEHERISLDQLQRRTYKVLIGSLEYLIEELRKQKLRQSLKAISQISS